MIYFQIFWSFFQIGLLSFGGGYASLPLIQEQVVDLHHWLSYRDFTDLITISQMTPGPIAINASTFVGLRLAGLPGALIATFADILPCFLIVTALAWLYRKYRDLAFTRRLLSGLRPAIVALISSAGLSLLLTALWDKEGKIGSLEELHLPALVLFLLSLFLYRRFKNCHPIWIMLGVGLAGGLFYYIFPL